MQPSTPSDRPNPQQTRRQFLAAAAGTATITGLAGCNGDSDYDRAAGVASRTADWPTVGHGYAHTSYAPEEAGPSSDPEIVWQRDIGIARGHPVIVEDYVVAPVGDGLTAYALQDGEEQWTYTAEDDAWTTPTVVDGRVFVASGHGALHVLDLESGDRLLEIPLPGYVSAPPTPDRRNRRLFVATDQGTIYAFPLELGEAVWSKDLFGQFRVAVSPTPYGLFAATTGGDVYCLDPEDGRGRWRQKLPGTINAAPAALKGDVYVPCQDGSIYHLRGERAGGIEWQSDRGGFARGALAIAGGTVFGGHGHDVVALDADDGTEEWSADVGGQAGSALAVAGDTLYAGGFGGGVHAFELDGPDGIGPLQFGGRKWSKSVPGGCGEGAAVANGTLVTLGEGWEEVSSKIVAYREP